MTEFENAVAMALELALYAVRQPSTDCQDVPEIADEFAPRVAAAIEAAVPNNSRLNTARERALAVLRGMA